jgi:holo-[acyl-carrier protein] synthase
MIVGHGVDICTISRFQESIGSVYGQKFIDTIFTKEEQAEAAGLMKPAAFYAKRYAAKEAFVKALGTGFVDVVPTDITVKNYDNGMPILVLKNQALTKLILLVGKDKTYNIQLSISDEKDLAIASVIIESV